MESFEQRKKEVKCYLDFLRTMEQIMSKEISITGHSNTPYSITIEQYKILISNTYIILYNLIESTILQCFKNIENSIRNMEREDVKNLRPELKQELVMAFAKSTNKEAAFDFIWDITEKLHKEGRIPEFKLNSMRQNWDDAVLEKKGKGYSINLEPTGNLRTLVKRPYRDNLHLIGFVKERRNKLAHGEMGFTEIANEETCSEVCGIANTVLEYLEGIISKFDKYISEKEYLEIQSS